ncbi:MAG: hypothetical protein OIF57_19830 [Marinobacterium sp.]|nr:hypothetical protein [Marinobacterium sp.]
MTTTDYEAWLAGPGDAREPVWLLEMDHADGAEAVAAGVYTAHDSYWPDVLQRIDMVDALDVSQSVTELVLRNTGDLDHWIEREWLGWPIRLYHGDRRWLREDFQLRGQMINGGVRAMNPQRAELSFNVLDALAELNVPIGGASFDGQPMTCVLGTPYNVTAPLHDSNLGYRLHPGPGIIQFDDVRDRGGSVAYTANDPPGGFRLQAMNRGTVTVDPVGPGATPAELVTLLCDGTRLTPNADNLAQLPTWPLGMVSRTDALRREVLDQLLQSLSATAVVNLANELEIRQLTPPSSSFTHQLSVSDVLELEMTAVDPAYRSIEIRWGKNHTVMDAGALNAGTDPTQGGISADDRLRLSAQWQTEQVVLSANRYAPQLVIDSCWTTLAAVQAQLLDLQILRRVDRYYARVRCDPAAIQSIRAGQTIRVTYPRFGFAGGRTVRVLRNELSRNELEIFW